MTTPTVAAPAVYAAIGAVMADMGVEGIAKSRKNQAQGYNFRGIDDVYNALNGSLSRHGLVMLPRVLARSQEERTNKSGGAIFYTTVDMEFDLVATGDGSHHTIRVVGEAMDSADKSSNKAMSAAYKYGAMQAFCIPTEGDNDADSHTHEPAPKAASATVEKPNGAPAKAEVNEAEQWLGWTERFAVAIQGAKDAKEIEAMQVRQKDKLAALRVKFPEYADRVTAAAKAQVEKLLPLGEDDIPF